MADKDSNSDATREHSRNESSKCLDFDSLTSIFPHIDERRDLLSFISTRRDLYAAGVPMLLQFPCVVHEGNLEAFYHFLKSKAPSSFLGLRNLTLDLMTLLVGARLSPAQVGMLADVLREARALTMLQFDAALLLQDESIAPSIASLTTLECISITGTHNEKVGTILARLQSPLQSVGAALVADQDDPLPILARWQSSLKEVTVHHTMCVNEQCRFSSVTYLCLELCSWPLVPILLPAFPKLQHLIINTAHPFLRNGEPFDELREVNIQYQKDHPTEVWRLTSFETDMATLYILGLQGEIPRVTVTNFCPPQYSAQLHGELQRTFAQFKPLHVTLVGFDDPPANADGIADIFAIDKGIDSVKRLDLSLALTSETEDAKDDIDMFFHDIGGCTAFFESEIFMLSCTFVWVPQTRRPGVPHSRRAEQYLDALKMRTLARYAAWALPSLAIAHFRIVTPQGVRESYWTFDEGGRPVEWPADEHRVIRHCDAAFELAVKERVTREGFDEFMHGLINPQNSLWDRLRN